MRDFLHLRRPARLLAGLCIFIIGAAIGVVAWGGNQAISINKAKYVMKQLLTNGKVVRGYMGVAVQELTPPLAKAFNAPAEKGALIANVDANSPAAQAGLDRGDVITDMNGVSVTGPNELRRNIGTMTPGATVQLIVLRNGRPRNVTLTLG